MAERTLFYPRELIGQGTGQVESLRSYAEGLSLAHHMKPRVLLETLLRAYPFEGPYCNLQGLVKDWAIHGFSDLGSQIGARLELATGRTLVGATLARYQGLFSSTNLTRPGEPLYCPCCVAETEELPYGRLLWEIQCVTACPVHRVKLRSSKVCGAPTAERLPAARRPTMRGVCMGCGSVGFKCVKEPSEPASDDAVWAAQQVGRLLAMDPEALARCSPRTVRQGLAALVQAAYGGSVVLAALQAGLSRGAVCMWVKGTAVPGLPWLLRLCFHSGADVIALLGGSFRRLGADEREQSRQLSEVVEREYTKRPTYSKPQLKKFLLAALDAAEPLSPAELSRRLGLHRDQLRKRCPEESQALAAAHDAHRRRVYEQRYRQAVGAYTKAACALRERGKRAHAKALQVESGVVAFSRNAPRVRALREVMSAFARGADETEERAT